MQAVQELIPRKGENLTAGSREVVWYQQLLRISQVARIVGVSKPTLHRMVATGEFPAPIKLNKKVHVWGRIVVDEWVTARLAPQLKAVRHD